MNKGLFVTGTGTDVGKTVVTRGIVRAFRNRGLDVGALKPIESGAVSREGRLVGMDATALARAAGADPLHCETSAYLFPDPVSPHLAARNAGVEVDLEAVLALLHRHIHFVDILIAEGAGGLLVPINENVLYAHLIALTGFRAVIVAPNALGSINAALLTVEAAQVRGIDVAGVILNRTPTGAFGNAEAIHAFGEVPVLGEVPDVPEGASDDDLAAIIEDTVYLDALLPGSVSEGD